MAQVLKPISKQRTAEGYLDMYIMADKYNRLCLNSSLRRELPGQHLYLYWDEENRTIGISAKGYDSDHVPYKFGKRGYSSAGDFLKRCEIDVRDGVTIKFLFDGNQGDILLFRQAGQRKHQGFKQEKNGNLERYA